MHSTNSSPPPTLTRLSWLGGRIFFALGILLALGALALPVLWLNQPDEAPAVPQAAPEAPVLLPETPLLEDLPEPEREQAQAKTSVDVLPIPPAEIAVLRPPERLVIPAIELDSPIEAVGWETVQVGGETLGQWQVPNATSVGWHETSAGPGGDSNIVLNGHHNLYGQVFRRLVELEIGDELTLWSGETEFGYVVTETTILPERGQPMAVRLANAERILPSDDERITLVTCWPYSGNSHRLVVVAKPMAELEPILGEAILGSQAR